MRLAIICPYSLLSPGGVQNQVAAEARYFAAKRCKVTLVAPDNLPPNALPQPNFDFVAMGRSFKIPGNGSMIPLSFPLFSLRRLVRLLNTFDILHFHEPFYPFSALLMKYCTPPKIATFHAARLEHPFYKYGNFLFRSLYRSLNQKIAVSPLARETVRKHFGGEIKIIPNAVDSRHEKPRINKLNSNPYILFIGRNEKRKGFPVLKEAYSIIRKSYPNLQIKAIGDGLGTNTGSGIEYLGKVTALPKEQILSGAAIFCAPSLFGESFGIVLIEAMAAGVPVIASDIPGYRDVIENRKTGLLVPPGNPHALAKAIVELLEAPKLRLNLVQTAFKESRKYSWRIIGEKYESIFHKTLNRAVQINA